MFIDVFAQETLVPDQEQKESSDLNSGVDGEDVSVADFRDPFRDWFPMPESEDFEFSSNSMNVEYTSDLSESEKFDKTDLKITGIVWGEAAPKAIINSEIYGIGDTIKDAEILNIDQKGILLKFKGREYLIKRASYKVSEMEEDDVSSPILL